MKRIWIATAFIVLIGIIAAFELWHSKRSAEMESAAQPPAASGTSEISLEDRLRDCGSFPNGSTQTVTDTSRVFVNLPKDIYPAMSLNISGYGATAGNVSNGGMPGDALDAQGRPDCSSWYLEFDLGAEDSLPGSIEISATSAVAGLPDYKVRFRVMPYSQS